MYASPPTVTSLSPSIGLCMGGLCQVQLESTGNIVLDLVDVEDNLAGVLDDATYQNDIKTELNGAQLTDNGAQITEALLTWNGELQPGDILTISYSVIVNEGVEGQVLENRVTASGTPPGDPDNRIVPPPVVTEHPVADFEVLKTANPASGSAVEPGQVIEYTITGKNTGAIVLGPASIDDDLSDVLKHATYNDDVTASVGEVALDGQRLAWRGNLEPEATVEITYSVTVAADAGGVILHNIAQGSGTPLTPDPDDPNAPPVPGEPVVTPSSETEHPVNEPGLN